MASLNPKGALRVASRANSTLRQSVRIQATMTNKARIWGPRLPDPQHTVQAPYFASIACIARIGTLEPPGAACSLGQVPLYAKLAGHYSGLTRDTPGPIEGRAGRRIGDAVLVLVPRRAASYRHGHAPALDRSTPCDIETSA